MRVTLGFDTSCYTTSAAAVDEHGAVVAAERMLLPVREGQRGLRQSEAVFAHVRQMPQVMEALGRRLNGAQIAAVCASARPRDGEDSYMPVFTVGLGHASVLASALGVPLYETSHQQGHIAAGPIFWWPPSASRALSPQTWSRTAPWWWMWASTAWMANSAATWTLSLFRRRRRISLPFPAAWAK